MSVPYTYSRSTTGGSRDRVVLAKRAVMVTETCNFGACIAEDQEVRA